VDIKDITDRYILKTYNRYPVVLEKGEGVYLFDDKKNKYLDFFSGIAVCNLGYNHPKINKAAIDQIKKLYHASNFFYTKPQAILAKKLVEKTVKKGKIFFCNSGTEAVEGALKAAKRYMYLKGEKEYKILSFKNSFHGRTLGALSVTGQEKYWEGFDIRNKNVVFIDYNDSQALKSVFKKENIKIVILELIQGEGGINVASKEFINELLNIKKSKEFILIVDEIQTGIGRTSKLFCYEHYNFIPDIITLGKALGNGFPIGAFILKDYLKNALTPGTHGSTFGGNPISCSVANIVIDEVSKDEFLKHVDFVSNLFFEKLKDLERKFSFLKNPRGKGLILGISTKVSAREIAIEALKEGLIIGIAGNDDVLRFEPPLIIKENHIEEGFVKLEKVLSKF